MSNNIGANLPSTLKLLRRITRSAAQSEASEPGPPTLPQQAADMLRKVEAAQNAASTGELSGLTATGSAAPEISAGASVAAINLIVAVALVAILAVGTYLVYHLQRPSSGPSDRRPEILTPDEAH